MKPSIGRIVIFFEQSHLERTLDQSPVAKAAIISGVNEDGSVDLHVFQPVTSPAHRGSPYTPVTAVGRVTFSETKSPGSWNWPTRVDESKKADTKEA
jgi:hypothetical protein